MAGKVVSVTSYDQATGRAVVDVFGQSLVGVLNVTGEILQPGWVVWVEQRGEALHADWVVTGIYSPVNRLASGTDEVATLGTTTSATYVASLTTGGAGPTITNLQMTGGHEYLIIVSAVMSSSTAGGFAALMTPVVSGASTLAAADINAAKIQDTAASTVTRATLWIPSSTGLHTITANYKQINGVTATFSDRRLIVKA
jgi:hypothetical protein